MLVQAARSGVVRLTIQEWCALDDDTRAALADAGTAVRAEQAMLLVAAFNTETVAQVAEVAEPGARETAGNVQALNAALAGVRRG
jgi:hypothetical protein